MKRKYEISHDREGWYLTFLGIDVARRRFTSYADAMNLMHQWEAEDEREGETK
jgi:hypothetical protein